MLGVATLIIVMAVMNGFRRSCSNKILGLNGHCLIQPLEAPLTDCEAVAERISKVPGIRLAAPMVEGQALASSPFKARAACLVRGIACRRPQQAPVHRRQSSSRARWRGSTRGRACSSAAGLPISSPSASGDNVTLVAPRGAVTPMGTTPRIKTYKVAGGVRDRHVGIRPRLLVHAADGGTGLFQPRRRRHRDRGLHRQPRPAWTAIASGLPRSPRSGRFS